MNIHNPGAFVFCSNEQLLRMGRSRRGLAKEQEEAPAVEHLVAQCPIFMREVCRLIPCIRPVFEANIEGARIAQPIGEIGLGGPEPPQSPYVSRNK